MTMKEHPVKPGRIVHYLHECKMTEMFKERANNQIAKWASVVFPTVFGFEIVGLDTMKKMIEKKGDAEKV